MTTRSPGPPRAYQQRVLDGVLDELMPALPAVALEGAKAVGKTATALQRAATIRKLDEPEQQAVAAADVDRMLDGPRPVLIDEWQYVKPVWDRVRRAVDDGAAPGSFILTGSTSPKDTGTHSGGGRIVSVRMRPMSLAERWPGAANVSLAELLTGSRPAIGGRINRGLEEYTDEILRSGFPGIRTLNGRPLRSQLEGYLERVVDRGFEELGTTLRNPAALRRWMRAYAAATATTASFEKIRNAATGRGEPAPARSTVQPYRDVLERLFLLDEVRGWQPSRNQFSQLSLSPKHHLADPALAASLLGASAGTLLEGRAIELVRPDKALLGALFESLVTLSLKVYAQAAEAAVRHFRTRGGRHEVDLIIEGYDGRIVAIEVKLSETAREESAGHLNWLGLEIGAELLDKVIITTGKEAYRRKDDGIAVIPAGLLGP